MEESQHGAWCQHRTQYLVCTLLYLEVGLVLSPFHRWNTKAGEGKPKVTQLTQNSNLCQCDFEVRAPNLVRDCKKNSASLLPLVMWAHYLQSN